MRASTMIAAVLLAASPAHALECSSSRAHDGRYWSYREIDGRRCWYPGSRGMSKARLRWVVLSAKGPARPRPTQAAPVKIADPPAPVLPAPLPPSFEGAPIRMLVVRPVRVPSFEERFNGASK